MTRRQINFEELQQLYVLTGRGIWHLQYLESAINMLITLKKDIKYPSSVSLEEANRIHSKNKANTLGVSLKIVEEENLVSDELLGMLKDFKEERNWLVHRSLDQNGEDLYLDELRYILIKRIESFSANAIKLRKLVSDEVIDFNVSKGVSKDWINQYAEQQSNSL